MGNLLEERLARLEGTVEELSKRLDDLRNGMNHRLEAVDKRLPPYAEFDWRVKIWKK